MGEKALLQLSITSPGFEEKICADKEKALPLTAFAAALQKFPVSSSFLFLRK